MAFPKAKVSSANGLPRNSDAIVKSASVAADKEARRGTDYP